MISDSWKWIRTIEPGQVFVIGVIVFVLVSIAIMVITTCACGR